MATYSGAIDFTILCRLWKQHRELFNMADFKDGQHALIYVTLHERKEPDDHGNTHYLQADCKKAERKEGLSYYIGSRFKPKSFGKEQSQATTKNTIENESDLPF